jgi:branched-chain amino acid transport system substrate-binding protein
MIHRCFRPLAFALVLTMVLGPVLAPRPGAAADPFEIDVVLPITGSGAFLGKTQSDMLNVLEGVVNRGGGINGQPVKFVIHDDQSTPQQGVQIMTALLAKHVAVVMGSSLVAVCNAMAPLARDGPLMYCFSTAFHPADGSLAFSSGTSTVVQIAAAVHYLRDRGFKRIAVITSTDASGQDGDHIIDDLFAQPENAGMSVVAHEHFAIGDVSVAAQMAHIRAANAQALIAWTTGSPLGTVLHGVSEAGLDLPFIGGSGNLTYVQMKTLTPLMPHETYFPGAPAIVPDVLPNGPTKRAVLEYQAACKAAGVHPDIGNAFGWDQTLMVVGALRKYGTGATPGQIRDFIVNSHWNGIAGHFDFKAVPQRGLDVNDVIMVQWRPEKDDWIGVSRPGGGLK